MYQRGGQGGSLGWAIASAYPAPIEMLVVSTKLVIIQLLQ